MRNATEQNIIRQCRPPRNKAAHGSFAELMIELAGEAPGRQLDNRTLKPLPLAEDDIIEGAIAGPISITIDLDLKASFLLNVNEKDCHKREK